jgi:hypothetical protein
MAHESNVMRDSSAEARSGASYQFYLDELSGISFERLARFSQPLLELFDVEPHHWRLPRAVPSDRQLLDAYTSALAAAEMFWSYFTLDEAVRRRFLPELKAYFVGAEPMPHEEADFLLLVDCMRVQWEQLGGSAVGDETHRSVGALIAGDVVPDLETLALFGEPLMGDPELYDNPDKLDEIMTRVQDYWLLAHTRLEQYEQRLDEIVARHGNSPAEMEHVRVEAESMVARFRELFAG